ncbi:peptidase S8 [Streptomyces sp. WAC 06738]|uniref:S8 family serine peptidase n=1 Tax=Streptomyces sp. WAC 06738 TaxID=2203210 RepID=UPI000F6CF203|nr:S8 family serine peptidase [Streptomyces sp. WAC 06738]AZM46503.1 peptidase S8 [Streptomyces sp. WAC 06738]
MQPKHGRLQSILAGLLVTGLTVSPLTSSVTANESASAITPASRLSTLGSSKTVTLITGDKVVVSTGPLHRRSVTIEPAPGREEISFTESRTEDGQVSILPSDVVDLVAAGKVDRRLFDVSGLIKQKYDDSSSKQLPLIVTYGGGKSREAEAGERIIASGAKLKRDLTSLRGSTVTTAKEKLGTLWSGLTEGSASKRTLDPGVAKVWLDARIRANLADSVRQVGAPSAWEAGFTGKGVKVAVLDTGIDPGHPDLADAVVAAKDFTDSGSPAPTDDLHGHGTHVASIITGSGAASNGTYRGVAPDAQLLNGKVLDDGGYGSESGIIAGMEWASDEGARVVNMSLGGCPSGGTDPMSQAVNRLTEQSGTLFVIAAGNHPGGQPCADNEEQVSSPADADHALAVGSVTKADTLSDFSNYGPRVGDGAVKPELTAPGEGIIAARAGETDLGQPVDDSYTKLSGTSMAAPHAAATAAILAQQHQDWDADELRSAMMGSAAPHPALGVFQQGAGRVDLSQAIDQQVLAFPAVLSMGTARWPHGDDPTVTSKVTYRNTGQNPVTLDLSVSGTDPAGDPAPAGMFGVSPARITIAAGGSAEASVTADSTIDGPDGLYSGQLTASTGSTTVVRTPIGIVKEVESYDLTIDTADRAGNRAATPVYLSTENAALRKIYVDDEPVTLRLPKNEYDLSAAVFTPGAERDSQTLVTRPELNLTSDTTVTLDARDGLPVRADVDSPTAKPVGVQSIRVDTPWLGLRVWGGYDANNAADLYSTPTEKVDSYSYLFGFTTSLVEPEPLKGSDRLPRGYNLDLTTQGRIPNPPTYRVHDSELAAVHSTVHGQGVGEEQTTSLRADGFTDDGWGSLTSLGYDVRTPGKRIDFYTGRNGLRWVNALEAGTAWEYDAYDGFEHRYEAGKEYDRHWNAAAIGPIARPVFAYDRLWAALGAFSTSSPLHLSGDDGSGVTGSTTLTRNGVLVGTNDTSDGGSFDASPDETAEYILTTKSTRDVPWSVLATQVEATWTFKAGPVEEFERLSLPNLRMTGAFDLLDQAPAHQPFPLKVSVEDPSGAKPQVEQLSVEASFNDGRTWTKLKVQPDGDRLQVVVPRAPKGAAFVSLRATATDSNGASIKQTVIRAYGLSR